MFQEQLQIRSHGKDKDIYLSSSRHFQRNKVHSIKVISRDSTFPSYFLAQNEDHNLFYFLKITDNFNFCLSTLVQNSPVL